MAPAKIIAPVSGRIAISLRSERWYIMRWIVTVKQSQPRSLLSQHAEAAAKDQQNAGENDKQTATAATTPGPVRALRVEITTPAEWSHAHKSLPWFQARLTRPRR